MSKVALAVNPPKPKQTKPSDPPEPAPPGSSEDPRGV
jgi:hypothetical protein